MISHVIEFSARNRLLVLLVVAAASLCGLWLLQRLPVDALPDLSDTQVIVYSRWERSPDVVEDQITYPIVTSLLGLPKVKAVRGYSDFGYSFVYVIFEDNTDIYWARSRTLEYLSTVRDRLPEGATVELGPDATGLGWIYQYAVVDDSGKASLADLRATQEWYLRSHLRSVPGVSEVATVGGFGRQIQVSVDPLRLQQYGLSMRQVTDAVRGSNSESGGRLLEFGGTEFMIRSRGYARTLEDVGSTVLAADASGSAIRVRDIGEVSFGPDLRRGTADLDGKGETVTGIVVMRHGENARNVIARVRDKLDAIQPGLPTGIRVVPVYDRSELIDRSIGTLREALIEVMITVAVVILLFLWHVPSAIIPILTIPLAVVISFVPFHWMGVTANIMSLGGIAIAVGAMVDAAIVVVEQSHKKLEEWETSGRQGDPRQAVITALKEVGGPSFYALLVIGISFLPVLALEAQEGRLFHPLAYTKTLAMVVAAVLAITLDPALRLSFMHFDNFRFRPWWLCRAANAVFVSHVTPEEQHPVSRRLIRLYEPAARWTLDHRWAVIAASIASLLVTVPIYRQLGEEFMPPLDEGAAFYMPSTMPGISIAEAQNLLQTTDRVLREFPEVDRVLGKAGRADSATDPAPLSMIETVITLKPHSEWRRKVVWYSGWAPEWLKPALRWITPDQISTDELVAQFHAALKIPGVFNAWTMPIRSRMDMLSTGIRTAVGLKIQGADLATIEKLSLQAERALKEIAGTRSVFAERAAGGYFLDIVWNRDQLARYGLTVEEAQVAVTNAIGGENVTTIVQGRERYPVNVRYMRDFRSDPSALEQVLVSAPGNRQTPLGQLAAVQFTNGPSMIRNENGLLTGYVYVDVAGRDAVGYVEEARRRLRAELLVPPGYSLEWSGQWEAVQRVRARLAVIVPFTLLAILILIYLNSKSLTKTIIILCSVPFAAVGAVWCLWLLGYNLSVAVWVGIIALLGVDAETGVFMLLYLDLAWAKAQREGRLTSFAAVRETVIEGSVKRMRPKFMTVATTFVGLLPVLWATGTGADVMKRIAAPMVGGIATSFLLELFVYPAVYEIWRWDFGLKRQFPENKALRTGLPLPSHGD